MLTFYFCFKFFKTYIYYILTISTCKYNCLGPVVTDQKPH